MSDAGRLSFHVPAPAVRPGGTPDFSDVKISPAGEVRRPEIDVAAEDIRDLAYSIIRVLNREGEAVGPWAGQLTKDELLEVITHLAFYGGWPVAMSAANVAKKVFEGGDNK